MKLNIPILDRLENSKSVLIVGIGGGFDVYAGLPLYFEIKAMNKKVHLANYTFMDVGKHTDNYCREGNLLYACGRVKDRNFYYPEGYLAEWLRKWGEEIPVYLFPKSGFKPLQRHYEELIKLHNIDTIIMVDGGVDSLMRGDEVGCGTVVEDAVSMSVVNEVKVSMKILACIGFGTEFEEKVSHYSALENMASLAKGGYFLGSCSLAPGMQSFQLYKQAYEYCVGEGHRSSHIASRIIPAVEGEFGSSHQCCDTNHGGNSEIIEGQENTEKAFLSPLMGVYWFYDFPGVAKNNLLLTNMAHTTTFTDARQVWRQIFYSTKQRQPQAFPLK